MIRFSAGDHFDFSSDEYCQLCARARATPFQHPDWLTPFYEELCTRKKIGPLIVTGRNARDELLAMIPLLRRFDGSLQAIEYAFLGVTDYACPVVLCGALQPDDTAQLRESFARALGDYGALRIEPVREEHVGIWRMLIATEPAPMEYGAHSVTFQLPYPDWRRQTLSGRRRNTIDRKARRLADKGTVRLDVLEGEDIRTAFGEAKNFRKGRFADDPLQDEDFLNFYARVAIRGQASGMARTYRLSCAGETVAVVFGVMDEREARFCYLVLGCNYPTYSDYSPGIVALDRVMANWAESGGKIFDFTVGDEPFKADFGCVPTPMFRFVENR